MAQSLTQIAQSLRDANKKVQLIYAFNGTGKTRLSREFKELIAPKNTETEEEEAKAKILYYNAFTEDLFYWDNDLDNDVDRKLKIQPNDYTKWILQDQGQEPNIAAHFQRYTSDKLTPGFNDDFSEVRFSFERGDDSGSEFVKISKGEESCFIWSVFHSLLAQTINVLNEAEQADRDTDQFDDLQYVFIDDPVSSLDDTHLIELAVNIAELIKSSKSELKFIITTHNPLFYNVLFNEFNRVKNTIKWRLEKRDDGTFSIGELASDSPFSYHLFLLSELEKAIQSPNDIKKFHFNFLRNILEKTSTFLGYNKWEDLLPRESREAYYKRIINLSSHSKHHGEEIAIIEENDKRVLSFLVEEIKRRYGFKSTINPNVIEENGTV
ncbi:anticodon nuclease [Elizabethkingia meningoseptica]|uniref:AAA family ATPase n=1 Tax=Elizabethkingia meningoseptica TaxID=238 RepID=UPI0008A9454D|nr:AAA family ATPase [Elizabethkingia meningoseptica]MDE5448694.1 AAA family ATPase [Elizabethkingia meningoseptica]MDE5469843.1 AAA family ATPase [Elizabethkingia meningoseptica]MDE5518752.1 AAA family ATPase [Elizabethkingia meningoseptica]MDE5522633.1 AAA family ATPase [Elizabethkingia meningoseptica]OHT31567.1 anticodon nuclease [Elizabethkingia meningoseptica]